MAQVERATSSGGKRYLTSKAVVFDDVEAKNIVVGGKDNVSGLIQVLDGLGDVKGTLDKDGIQYDGLIGATGFGSYSNEGFSQAFFLNDDYILYEPFRYEYPASESPQIFRTHHVLIDPSYAQSGHSYWGTNANTLRVGVYPYFDSIESGDPTSSYPALHFSDLDNSIDIYTGILRINDLTGITTSQTFKDGSGSTKTMTITNGIITGIS